MLAGISVLTGCVGSSGESASDPWSRADEIVAQIQEPVIPSSRFLFSEFGGQGDGIRDNKAAFDRVIEACAAAGGGSILVEAGTYLVNGPITPREPYESSPGERGKTALWE